MGRAIREHFILRKHCSFIASGEMIEASCHLSCEDALKLAEQLKWLVENHYHHKCHGGLVSSEEDSNEEIK